LLHLKIRAVQILTVVLGTVVEKFITKIMNRHVSARFRVEDVLKD
jgi:hypothetical protein